MKTIEKTNTRPEDFYKEHKERVDAAESALAYHEDRKKHLEAVQSNIESDHEKTNRLRNRLKGRKVLGISLPGVSKIESEIDSVNAVTTWDYLEESSAQEENARSRSAANIADLKVEGNISEAADFVRNHPEILDDAAHEAREAGVELNLPPAK